MTKFNFCWISGWDKHRLRGTDQGKPRWMACHLTPHQSNIGVRAHVTCHCRFWLKPPSSLLVPSLSMPEVGKEGTNHGTFHPLGHGAAQKWWLWLKFTLTVAEIRDITALVVLQQHFWKWPENDNDNALQQILRFCILKKRKEKKRFHTSHPASKSPTQLPLSLTLQVHALSLSWCLWPWLTLS